MEKKLYGGYGRTTKQIPSVIENEDGLRLKVVAVDTAGDGVSILCNIYQRDVVTPGGSFIRDGKPVELVISLDLPDEDGRVLPVVARCHIAYSRRISKEQCVIGMRYVDFVNNSHERLLKFINKSMAVNEEISTPAYA